jgi:hypothetical protein
LPVSDFISFHIILLISPRQPFSIQYCPDSSFVASVDKDQTALQSEHKAIFDKANAALVSKEKNRKRGRNKISAKLRRKQKNVVDAQTVKLREKLAKEKEERENKQNGGSGGGAKKDDFGVLSRFLKKK